MKTHLRTRSNPAHHNAGFTVIELTVTMILLGMLMALVVPMLSLISQQQRESERRVVAVQLIGNMMERMTSNNYEAITQSAAEEIQLPAEEAPYFPDAKLTVTVTETDSGPNAKQITIVLSWNDSHGVAVAPARLTTYVYSSGRKT